MAYRKGRQMEYQTRHWNINTYIGRKRSWDPE
jgi:hypothetical protein